MPYYLWIFLTTFLNSNVTLYSALTTFGLAFALTVAFPPATFMLFGVALAISGGLYLYNAGKHYKEQEHQQQLKQELADLIAELIPLNEKLAEDKEKSIQLAEKIKKELEIKYYVTHLTTYCMVLSQKYKTMSEEDKDAYLHSEEGIALTQALNTISTGNVPTDELVELSKKLENIIKSPLSDEQWKSFCANHHLSQHPALKTQKEYHTEEVHPVAVVGTPSYTPRSIPGLVLKTTFFSFAFTLVITGIISALLLAAPPVAIAAAMPLAVVVTSGAILGACLLLGFATALFYKKVIAPQEKAALELPHKVTEAKANLHECKNNINVLERKIQLKSEKLEEVKEEVQRSTFSNQHFVRDLKNTIAPEPLDLHEARKLVHPKMAARAQENIATLAAQVAPPKLDDKQEVDPGIEISPPGGVPHE